MERRDLLKLLSFGTVAGMGSQLVWKPRPVQGPAIYEDIAADPLEIAQSIDYMSTPAPDLTTFQRAFKPPSGDASLPLELDDYLNKIHNFEEIHNDDVYLDPTRNASLISTFSRLGRLQTLVGHGNFNVIGFDDMLKFGRRYTSVSPFEAHEVAFLEEMFGNTAASYGFFGEKVTTSITARVRTSDRVKVPYTGHFLFKGESLSLYQKLSRDVGHTIVLTSGIRSVVKQSHLFLAKTIQAKGNLSRASRSLAPPGHSFHGIGDFDVGKVGLGTRNFTDEFARTQEFQRLVELGYIEMRYPADNFFGVRYEPWHIKVV